jgi:hypothetical protein
MHSRNFGRDLQSLTQLLATFPHCAATAWHPAMQISSGFSASLSVLASGLVAVTAAAAASIGARQPRLRPRRDHGDHDQRDRD